MGYDVEGLTGLLNLGIIICEGTSTDFVHIPVEDAREIVQILNEYKKLKEGDEN